VAMQPEPPHRRSAGERAGDLNLLRLGFADEVSIAGIDHQRGSGGQGDGGGERESFHALLSRLGPSFGDRASFDGVTHFGSSYSQVGGRKKDRPSCAWTLLVNSRSSASHVPSSWARGLPSASKPLAMAGFSRRSKNM